MAKHNNPSANSLWRSIESDFIDDLPVATGIAGANFR